MCEALFSWEVCSWIKKLTPGGSAGKESTCNAGDKGDVGSVPESGRSPGRGNSYPLQYSCLENSRDRGTWWVTVHGVAKSQILWSMYTHTHSHTHTKKPIFTVTVHVCSHFRACHIFFCIDPLSQDPGLQGTSLGFL